VENHNTSKDYQRLPESFGRGSKDTPETFQRLPKIPKIYRESQYFQDTQRHREQPRVPNTLWETTNHLETPRAAWVSLGPNRFFLMFRDLIKGYALIESPLRNLLCQVPIPAGAKKHKYQQTMRAFKLKELWKVEHTNTFLTLKAQLSTLSPKIRWNTLYSNYRWMQGHICRGAITENLPSGKEVTRLHPIAFTSKRTLTSEEKYKPFLLEFAALKYSFDKFSEIVYGYPVEVETDCQALHYMLMNDKLSATHARWRDGVLAHNITDIHHVPGITNIANGLSRQYEDMPKSDTDGSTWDVDPDWESRAGLAYSINCISISPSMQNLRNR
jgi:hypothetical protein